MSRRGFLKCLVGVLSVPLAAFLGWPMLSSIIGPLYRLDKARFVKVGSIDALPLGIPVSVNFAMPTTDAYIRSNVTHAVWVIKHSAARATVFSPVCPHLGCHYDWYVDARKFICPCHGSVFSADGKVVAGPSPRPLDTLPSKIENGDLYVMWELFEVGVAEKLMIG